MKNKITDDTLVLIPAFNEGTNIIKITNAYKNIIHKKIRM